MNSIEFAFTKAFIVLAFLLAADIFWMRFAGFELDSRGVEHVINSIAPYIGVFASLYLLCRILQSANLLAEPLEKLRVNEFSYIFLSFVLFFLANEGLLIFQYLCIANSNEYKFDEILLAADRLIGFNWIECYNYIMSNQNLKRISRIFYVALEFQLLFCVIAFPLMRRFDRLFEFFYLHIISGLSVSVIAMLVPARSMFVIYKLNQSIHVSDFFKLRSGDMVAFDIVAFQGLVSFPSLHAVAAVVFPYVFRGIRFVFPISLAINFLMLIATPIEGGHYLTDVIFGVGLGLVLIKIYRSLSDENE